jgi:hypothetical protein
MVIVFVILGFALILPLLLVAIALGPVIIGILCAVGCALLVFALANLVIGIVVGAERTGSRLLHRAPAPRARP